MPKTSAASNLADEIKDALDDKKIADATVKPPRAGYWVDHPIIITVLVARPSDVLLAQNAIASRFNLLVKGRKLGPSTIMEAYVPPNATAPGEATYPSFQIRITSRLKIVPA